MPGYAAVEDILPRPTEILGGSKSGTPTEIYRNSLLPSTSQPPGMVDAAAQALQDRINEVRARLMGKASPSAVRPSELEMAQEILNRELPSVSPSPSLSSELRSLESSGLPGPGSLPPGMAPSPSPASLNSLDLEMMRQGRNDILAGRPGPPFDRPLSPLSPSPDTQLLRDLGLPPNASLQDILREIMARREVKYPTIPPMTSMTPFGARRDRP
jgi:hypothetical protein